MAPLIRPNLSQHPILTEHFTQGYSGLGPQNINHEISCLLEFSWTPSWAYYIVMEILFVYYL